MHHKIYGCLCLIYMDNDTVVEAFVISPYIDLNSVYMYLLVDVQKPLVNGWSLPQVV